VNEGPDWLTKPSLRYGGVLLRPFEKHIYVSILSTD
jgi:hypothetical protein